VRAVSLLTSAFIADNAGDATQVEASVTQAVVAFRAIGERWGLSVALVMLSQRRSLLGDHQGAIAAYEEASQLSGELGSMTDVATARVYLAGARIASGNFDAAERDLREALASADRDGLDEVRFIALCGLARLARERVEFDQAWEHVTAAGQVLARLRADAGLPHQATVFGTTKAGVALATGDIEAATAALSDCLPRAVESRDMPVVASVGEWIARVVMLRGDAAGAAELLGATSALRGMAIVGDPDVRRTEERLVEQLGVWEYRAAFGRGAAYSREHAIGVLHDAVGRSSSPQPRRRL
jgi:tetratricopeptide (TPR) repeat protein